MPKKNTQETSQDFEKQLERLKQVVAELEQEDLPLEQGLALYKEGAELVKACRERLKNARNEVEILSQGVFEPFADATMAEVEED